MESYLSTGTINDILELSQDIVERVGDCSNFERKVKANSIFWKNVRHIDGLTLQQDIFSSKARIIDSKGVQKANGSITAMSEKLERMISKEFLRPGDVIGISRGAYEHYGIYSGRGKVIHYAGDTTDFKGTVSIHEAPFDEFLKNNADYFVISFEGKYPVKIHSSTKFVSGGYFDCGGIEWKSKYSAKETLERARSRIGETKYSIINNNCEHFAMWCKTGTSESTRVIMIARYMLARGTSLGSIRENRNDIVGYLAG